MQTMNEKIKPIMADGDGSTARRLEKMLNETIPVFAAVFNALPDGNDLKTMLNVVTPGLISYKMQLGGLAEMIENNFMSPKPPQ